MASLPSLSFMAARGHRAVGDSGGRWVVFPWSPVQDFSISDEEEVAMCCWGAQVLKEKDTGDGCGALDSRKKSGQAMRLMEF